MVSEGIEKVEYGEYLHGLCALMFAAKKWMLTSLANEVIQRMDAVFSRIIIIRRAFLVKGRIIHHPQLLQLLHGILFD